jgi:DNA recombination-dependent growth factor C
MSAHAVGLTMDERLDFVLTEDCQVKSIKFRDICFVDDIGEYDTAEEEKKAEEDADWIIMKAEFKRLIEAIEVNFIKGEQSEF